MFETRADGLYYGKTRSTFELIEIVGDRVHLPPNRPWSPRAKLRVKKPKANAARWLQARCVRFDRNHQDLIERYFAAA